MSERRQNLLVALAIILVTIGIMACFVLYPAWYVDARPLPPRCCPIGSHCAHLYPPLPPCAPTPTPAPICRQGVCWR